MRSGSNSDIVTWPRRGNNVRREKVPSAPGGRWVSLVPLFSSETGEPLAIFPDGVMQRTRVGATNGLGAKYLSRPDSRNVGLLGSGWQAGTQLMAVCAVRDIERIRCFSPNKENREKFTREMTPILGVEVEPVDHPEDAIKGADIAMCATNSIDSIFFEKWVEPGMHLSEIKRPEIETAALARVDRVMIHTRDSSPLHFTTKDVALPEKVKGKGWAEAKSTLDIDKLPTLPDLIVGRVPGRDKGSKGAEQVTAFMNNLGMGYQLAAAGSVVYRKAKEMGAGHELPTDWFTEDVHP